MTDLVRKLWKDEIGQDIAEYAVMLAVILVLVVGTIRLVGSNANNAFSSVASTPYPRGVFQGRSGRRCCRRR
jgi:Flp pilus assembly pilin Flp